MQGSQIMGVTAKESTLSDAKIRSLVEEIRLLVEASRSRPIDTEDRIKL